LPHPLRAQPASFRRRQLFLCPQRAAI